MSKVIGIDLGTTNSCVAVMEGGEAVSMIRSVGVIHPVTESNANSMIVSLSSFAT